MDLGKLLQDVVTAPITLALASAAAFVLGLIARPYVEARSGLFKERATARTAFQRETLTEMQKVMAALDPRLDPDKFEELDPSEQVRAGHIWQVKNHRLTALTAQVRDHRVLDAIAAYRVWQEEVAPFQAVNLEEDAYYLDRINRAIGNALRDL